MRPLQAPGAPGRWLAPDDRETQMTVRHRAARPAYALAVIAAVAAIALTVVGLASPGGSPGTSVSLAPSRRRRRPGRGASRCRTGLPYCPTPRRCGGSPATPTAVSADQVSAGGMVQLYLNATPRQGAERLRGVGRIPAEAAALGRRGLGSRGRRRRGRQVRRRHRIVHHRPLTSPGSADTTTRRSPAWSRDSPAPASSSPPPPCDVGPGMPAPVASGGGLPRALNPHQERQ